MLSLILKISLGKVGYYDEDGKTKISFKTPLSSVD
jgi:hypothetical protein